MWGEKNDFTSTNTKWDVKKSQHFICFEASVNTLESHMIQHVKMQIELPLVMTLLAMIYDGGELLHHKDNTRAMHCNIRLHIVGLVNHV